MLYVVCCLSCGYFLSSQANYSRLQLIIFRCHVGAKYILHTYIRANVCRYNTSKDLPLFFQRVVHTYTPWHASMHSLFTLSFKANLLLFQRVIFAGFINWSNSWIFDLLWFLFISRLVILKRNHLKRTIQLYNTEFLLTRSVRECFVPHPNFLTRSVKFSGIPISFQLITHQCSQSIQREASTFSTCKWVKC